jgi:single-strand DNA-binding protein
MGKLEGHPINNLNSVMVEGRVKSNPKLLRMLNGIATCSFTIATERIYIQDEEPRKEVSNFEVCAYEKLAEVWAEYLKEGRMVRVVGRLKQDKWITDKNEPISKVCIIADHIEFRSELEESNKEDGSNQP